MTEWGQHMLKRTVRRCCQLSAESIVKDLQISCGLKISTTVQRELHGSRAATSKPIMNQASLSIQWTCLGLAVARRTVLSLLHCAKCKV
ncbi:unnamed protein product, partial [Staurois parvus]